MCLRVSLHCSGPLLLSLLFLCILLGYIEKCVWGGCFVFYFRADEQESSGKKSSKKKSKKSSVAVRIE